MQETVARFCTSLLILVVAGAALAAEKPKRPRVGHVDTLRTVYASWKAARLDHGSERTFVLPLRHAKGVSTEFTRARGRASLDLTEGTFSVEVRGLPDGALYDVWLVDNRPGGTVRPDEGDLTIRIGTLVRDASGSASYTTRLELDVLAGFEIDRVIVAGAGKGPDEGCLSGSTSLFQKLFFAEQSREKSGPDSVFGALVPTLAGGGEPELTDLVSDGEALFFEETFGGNGRTCGTCHPADHNLTIDPGFIATLPPDDPLFVASNVPELSGLENPQLLQDHALILVNNDGFDKTGVMRSVQHTLALGTSIVSSATEPPLHATGWSADGAPDSGTLRDFPTGAVMQHFPLTLNRVDGVDFVLPTEAQLDAMEAFQLSLGRAVDTDLEFVRMLDAQAEDGRITFLKDDTNQGTENAGKCNLCHQNGGSLSLLDPDVGFNANFDTGVENQANPAGSLPPDQGRGACDVGEVEPCGDGTFNTQTLIEAADTPGFFHNNLDDSIRDAIVFYGSGAFGNSPAGQQLQALDSGGQAVNLGGGGVDDVEAFLRVINADENARSAKAHAEAAVGILFDDAVARLDLALAEVDDGGQVLADDNLHADAQASFQSARTLLQEAQTLTDDAQRDAKIDEAAIELQATRDLMVVLERTFVAIPSEDGRVRENNAGSDVGGAEQSSDGSATALRVGDDDRDRQYKTILSFDTEVIPDSLNVVAATLEITRGDNIGAEPFGSHGEMVVDIVSGTFGTEDLEPGDFEAAPSAFAVATVADQGNSGSLHTVDLSNGLAFINKDGRTQLRIRMELDDNDDQAFNVASFFSANATQSSRRPRLVLRFEAGVGASNNPPAFNGDPLVKTNATANSAYGDSIAGDASDPDGDPLTFSRINGPAWLDIAPDGTLSGTPGDADVGLNSWTAQVADGRGGFDQTTLEITVDPGNHPPAFNEDPIAKPNARANQPYGDSLAADASDPDGDPLTFSKVSGPTWLDVAGDGALTGTPGAGDVGLNSWTVEVDDGNGGTDQATLEITVDPDFGQTVETFTSIASHDGRIREASEDSGTGGGRSANDGSADALRAGDDSADRQSVFILSFDTSSIPPSAVVTAARIEIVRGEDLGDDPFLSHGDLLVDMTTGTIGNDSLEKTDFQQAAGADGVAVFDNPASATGTVHTADLGGALGMINKDGLTQLRVRFAVDDDDDGAFDTAGFFAGDDADPNRRPRLVVTFE